MPKPLDRKSKRALNGILRAAGADINNALAAYNTCTFDPHHAAKLKTAHNVVACLRAEFEDKQYGIADDYTLYLICTYEMMAADLIDVVAIATAPPERSDEHLRVHGRHIVGRTLSLAGRTFRETTACNNPAVGLAYLDQWENEVRRSLHLQRAAA